MRFMPHWLAQRALLSPQRTALIYAGQSWTFAELSALADSAAHKLIKLGVQPGDRIMLLAQGSPAFVVLVHAITRVQAMLAPGNTRLTPTELAWQVQHAGISLLVTDSTHQSLAQAVQSRSVGVQLVHIDMISLDVRVSDNLDHSPANEGDLAGHCDLEAPFGILYTSGTTGHPKGAVLTYGNLWWSAIGSALNLGTLPHDCWLACLPLFHIGGLSILIRSVVYGIPVCLHGRFDPAAVNAAIEHDGVTIVSVVSTMLQRMITERSGRPYPPHLRCVLLGGGPAPRPLLEQCHALGVPVAQSYGLTETASQAATLLPAEGARKIGSAGKPLFPNEIKIEVNGQRATSGQVGEIIVRGPSVSPGYLQPGGIGLMTATDSAGWLHTGDLGYLDSDGYLYVLDRRDDLIISGGENIYPAEVEAVLLGHPTVAEAGVTGMADPEWGQVPVASVVLRTGQHISEEELLAYCRERLAGYKAPRCIKFVGQLPRTASGKLQRRFLQESLS